MTAVNTTKQTTPALVKTRYADCHPDKKHYCKGMCMACYETERRLTKPARAVYMTAYLKKYKVDNAESVAKSYAKRRADPKARIRDSKTSKSSAYKVKYGMSLVSVLELLAQQGFACALCKREITDSTMNVDHCHINGQIRGLVCRGCNTGLGLLGDNISGLLRAIAYLERTEGDSGRKTELLAQSPPTK